MFLVLYFHQKCRKKLNSSTLKKNGKGKKNFKILIFKLSNMKIKEMIALGIMIIIAAAIITGIMAVCNGASFGTWLGMFIVLLIGIGIIIFMMAG